MGAVELLGMLPSRKNWTINPSAEVNATTGAFPQGVGTTLTRDNTHVWVGSWAFKVVPVLTTSFAGAAFSVDLTGLALTGVVHTMQASCRLWAAIGVTIPDVRLRVTYTDATITDSTPGQVPVVGTGAYQTFVSAELRTNPLKTISTVRLLTSTWSAIPYPAGTQWWVDGVDIAINETLDTYVDGSMGNGLSGASYAWLGTFSPHVNPSQRFATIPIGIVGQGGVTTVVPHIYKSNIQGEKLDDLTEYVTGGEIATDIDRDIKTTLRLDVSDIRLFPVYSWLLITRDFYVERVLVASEVPAGLFRLGTPSATWPDASGTIAGFDPTVILRDSALVSTTNFSASITYASHIGSLLTGAGFAGRYDRIDETRQPPAGGKTYPAGTPKSTIVNDFLQAIGWYTIYARPSGRLGYKEYVDRHKVDPAYSYTVGDTADLVGTIDETTSDDDNYNFVIVTKQSGNSPVQRAYAENRNSKHPYSTVSLGALAGISKVYRTKTIAFNDAADVAALQVKANSTLSLASMLRTVTISTTPEPYHEPHEVIYLDLAAVGADHLTGSYYVNSYSFGLAGSESALVLRARRIESPDD